MRWSSYAEHPVALGSFCSWMKLVWGTRSIDKAYIPRLLFVSLTTKITSPLRLWEWIRYGRAIKKTAIHPSPIFIIGHWRSGTTHLHNLMCQDKNLGYVSTFQAMAPGFCFVGNKRIKPALAKLAHRRYPTRLIDNIPLALDAPQEDEFALATMTPYSFVHSFTFPKQATTFFTRYVLFEGISEAIRERWIRTYLAILRKATLRSGGRRLVTKNCGHSARIRTLLDLFPDAKFIFIHRNPYEVYLSTVHMHKTVIPRSQLQDADPDQIGPRVLRFFTQLMQRYLSDRSLIPEGNLVEVRFEDLEASPLDQLGHIYESLGLPGYDAVEPEFRLYLDSVSDYKKNAYELNDDVVAKVNAHWQVAFEAWGYERLTTSPQVLGKKGD